MKIAILGGSFDPIHQGHIKMARYALKKGIAQQVWFMVSKDTPLKERTLTPFSIRVKMVKTAISPYHHMQVCTLEQEREGKSYTIDTVTILKKRYPKDQFIWLIGNDQAKQLGQWKEIDRLLQEITFYVYGRNQEEIECEYLHVALSMEQIAVSSSEIRLGKKRWLLPKSVRYYIQQQALYIDDLVRSKMSEKRYAHSCRVAKVCVALAKIHGVKEEKAYLAGMLHDICKEWDKEKLRTYLQHFDAKCLLAHPAIWHGYAGAYVVAHAGIVMDPAICDAIYHHVTGEGTSKLAKILYISDKIEPGRNYDTTIPFAIAQNNLQKGFAYVKMQQEIYLKKGETHV